MSSSSRKVEVCNIAPPALGGLRERMLENIQLDVEKHPVGYVSFIQGD